MPQLFHRDDKTDSNKDAPTVRPWARQEQTGDAFDDARVQEDDTDASGFDDPPANAASQKDKGDPYSGDVFGLLGDVIQRPAQAFQHLASPGAEKLGLALIVFMLSRVPANYLQNPLDLTTDSTTLRLITNTVASVVALVIAAGLLHLSARILGGRNRYDKLLQTLAFASLPSLLMVPFLVFMPFVTDVPVWLMLPDTVASVWEIVLSIIAIRTVYNFSTGRALGTIVMLLFLFVVAGILFSLLAAFIGVSLGLQFLQ